MRLGGSRIIRLTLQQMGEMVSGEAQISSRVPVSGRLSGSSALLGGALPTVEPCSRPSFLNDLTCAEEFRNIAISLDPLGRLVGTLEFSRDWWAGGSTSLPSHHTQAVRGELIDMIRQYATCRQGRPRGIRVVALPRSRRAELPETP